MTITTLSRVQTLLPNRPRVGSRWTIHCDGATLGSNPAPEGGWGFAVFCNGYLYHAQHGQMTGEITNQLSELWAINNALRWCLQRGLITPTIMSDSKVIIDVLNGECQLRNERLKLGLSYTKTITKHIRPTYVHVTRELEHQPFADFLANLGNHSSVSYTKQEQHEALIAAYERWLNHG